MFIPFLFSVHKLERAVMMIKRGPSYNKCSFLISINAWSWGMSSQNGIPSQHKSRHESACPWRLWSYHTSSYGNNMTTKVHILVDHVYNAAKSNDAFYRRRQEHIIAKYFLRLKTWLMHKPCYGPSHAYLIFNKFLQRWYHKVNHHMHLKTKTKRTTDVWNGIISHSSLSVITEDCSLSSGE